jgi:hypothetical protein
VAPPDEWVVVNYAVHARDHHPAVYEALLGNEPFPAIATACS